MDAHQAEAVRGMRTPIVVRPEPHVAIIVRPLFVIPAERVAARFGGFRVKEDPREVTPSSFNAADAAPAPWFGITSTSNCASRIALSYDVANTLSPAAPSCGQDHPGFAPSPIAHPLQMDG
jgi:hypothetical protein